MAGASDFSSFRFSTDELPPQERISRWRETFGRAIVKLEMQPLDDTPLRVKAGLRMLPDVCYASVESTAYSCERTPELARGSADEIGLVLVSRGTAMARQNGREVRIADGEAVVLRNNEAGSVHFSSSACATSFSISERVLSAMVPNLSDLSAHAMPADNAMLRLLARYVELLEANDELVTEEARHAVAGHIRDLVALAIGATRDATAFAGGRGLRAARLRAIKGDVTANLANSGLSVISLAQRQGISPSYVRKLFETDGSTFSQFVLGQRLERARSMLTDPLFGHMTISAVAFEAGFGDLSYFNRAFRRHYGLTPSDVRNGDETLPQ